MWRQGCLLLTFGLAFTATVCAGAESAVVNLDYVAQRALERAQKPFHAPRTDLPRVLQQDNLDYDKYREIEFRHDKALWLAEGLPFRVEFFHPGYLYQEPVHINEFTPTYTQPIRFVQDFFNYRALRIQNEIPANTGYAGFRLSEPVERAEQMGRNRRVSGRELFPAAGQGPALRRIRARPGAQLRRRRGRRNFPSSPTGGWASRSRATIIWFCSPSSTA